MKFIYVLLLVGIMTVLLSGCGLVPGVDCPIDEVAFWDPDIPDYADDGDPYSIMMLGTGTVYDHPRHVEWITNTLNQINVVSNLLIQIQNQITNLTGLSANSFASHTAGINKELQKIIDTNNQAQGLLNKNWNDVFQPLSNFYLSKKPVTLNEHMATNQNLQRDLDNTYKDALNIAKNNMDINQMVQLTQDVMNQNGDIVGNKQGKQLAGQGQAIKTTAIINQNQNMSAAVAVMVAQAARENQKQEADRQAAHQLLTLGASDPNHPTNQEKQLYNRPKWKGFINFK